MEDLVAEGVPLQLTNDSRVLFTGEGNIVEVDVVTTSGEELALVDAEVKMTILRVGLKGSGNSSLATQRT
jgi:hypothetical protein